MSEPYLGMVKTVGFNFAPQGYATCDGQLLSIAQNNALFALLGTTYGGDGQNTFALPDLRGRMAIHKGSGQGLTPRNQGDKGGAGQVTLTTGNMPAHTHVANFTNTSTLQAINTKGTSAPPQAGYQLARSIDGDGSPSATPFIYAPASGQNQVALDGLNISGTDTVTNSPSGGALPIPTRSPYLAINFIIALEGIFPTQN